MKGVRVNWVNNRNTVTNKEFIETIYQIKRMNRLQRIEKMEDMKFENMIKEMQNLNQKVCCESEESCCNEVRHTGYVPSKSNYVINKPFVSSIASNYYDLKSNDGIYVSNSLKDFSHRELNLIYNCKSYATDEPSGLSGHNLMMIINKFCELLDIDWSDLVDAQEQAEEKEKEAKELNRTRTRRVTVHEKLNQHLVN